VRKKVRGFLIGPLKYEKKLQKVLKKTPFRRVAHKKGTICTRRCKSHFFLTHPAWNSYVNSAEIWKWKTMRISNSYLIRKRESPYHCKSGIAIFSWTISSNYAYSPFKQRDKKYVIFNQKFLFWIISVRSILGKLFHKIVIIIIVMFMYRIKKDILRAKHPIQPLWIYF